MSNGSPTAHPGENPIRRDNLFGVGTDVGGKPGVVDRGEATIGEMI